MGDLRETKISTVDGFRDFSNERMYSIASLEKQAKYPSMKGSKKTLKEDISPIISNPTFDTEKRGEIGQKGVKTRKSRSELKAEARSRAFELEKSEQSFE